MDPQYLKQLMASCDLCNRHCHIDRNRQTGYCGQTAQLRAARAALHFWEEPCISGKNGSGAVFFSGCSLRCVFCQNHEIALDSAAGDSNMGNSIAGDSVAVDSHIDLDANSADCGNSTSKTGKTISIERLSEIFLELQEKGAHNINLVTPTHFVPQIICALNRAKKQGLTLPIVYNTAAYETVETLKMLDGLIDIYLPDLKYYSPELSLRYSNAPDYFACASAAIAEMFRQVGAPQFCSYGQQIRQPFPVVRGGDICSANYTSPKTFPGSLPSCPQSDTKESALPQRSCPSDKLHTPKAADLAELSENSLMKKGVIVRHLLLPGCIGDSKKVLSYLYQTYGDSIFVSIMSQYTPMPFLISGINSETSSPYPELARRITEEEYNEVVDYAISLGMENAFIQEMDVAEESFIPAFDLEGI